MLQFRLRTLLGMVVPLAAGGAWLASELHSFRNEQAIVQGMVNVQFIPAEPDWFWKPVSRFTGVKCVHVTNITKWSGLTEEEAIALRKLPYLESVLLDQTTSDNAVARLSEIPTLTSLDLGCNSTITSSGLRSLSKMTRLRRVCFRAPNATNAEIALLARLPNLTILGLNNSPATMAGVRPILEQGRLIELQVGSGFSDDDLRELWKYGSLRRVAVWSGNITDAGVLWLKRLPDLHELELFGAQLTPRIVEQLATFPKLTKFVHSCAPPGASIQDAVQAELFARGKNPWRPRSQFP